MTREPRHDPAAAGVTLVATIVLATGIGFGIGLLVGAPVPFVLGGLFLGSIAGFALVYTRFKDI